MKKNKIIALVTLCAMLFTITGCGTKSLSSSTKAQSNTSGYKIAFCNSYNGNSYRQLQEKLFKAEADKLVKTKVLAGYKILEANNQVATQVSQIESCVLEGYNAIMVDPASASGLNGAIEEAYNAKIPVLVVNDGPVTTNKCWQLNNPCYNFEQKAAEFVAKKLNGKGNVVIVRGIAGTSADTDFYNGMMSVFKKYSNIKIVSEVYGQWTNSVAQQQIASVLPGLKQVDAVLGEGGDEYGILQAFEAAKRDVPIIVCGNRGNFLSWWAKEKKANGYESFGWCCNAWHSVAGLYIMQDLIKGVNVPKSMSMPGVYVTQDTVDKYANMAGDDMPYMAYDYKWVKNNLYNQSNTTSSTQSK